MRRRATSDRPQPERVRRCEEPRRFPSPGTEYLDVRPLGRSARRNRDKPHDPAEAPGNAGDRDICSSHTAFRWGGWIAGDPRRAAEFVGDEGSARVPSPDREALANGPATHRLEAKPSLDSRK